MYNPLDDVPHSVRANLRPPVSPSPSHFSLVTATPSPHQPQHVQHLAFPKSSVVGAANQGMPAGSHRVVIAAASDAAEMDSG